MAETVHVLEHIHSVLRITSTTPEFLPDLESSKPTSPLFVLAMMIVLVQLLVTYGYTNAKRFSYRALIRNLTFGIGLYSFFTTGDWVYVLIPCLLEIALEWLKYHGYHLDKYIATEYMYSDYFRDINKENNMFSNLTEGVYDDMFGIDTRDHSEENVRKIEEWTNKIYYESHQNKSSAFVDASGQTHTDIRAIKLAGDNRKFQTISKQCEITPGMRILEVGFGEGDFMMYIRENYGISPIGISISAKQVEIAKSRGFTAYHMNMWDMTPEVLGTFDLIIQCGNMEYTRCSGESPDKYGDYFGIISKLLNPNGKHFVTCVHTRDNNIYDLFDSEDWFKAYYLDAGNDGAYPFGKDGLVKYADKNGLRVARREERTNDYWLTSIFFMSHYQYSKENNYILTLSGLFDAIIKSIAAPYYLHTYICMSPSPKDCYWVPWNWQFNPKNRNGKYESFVTLEYILFQKGDDVKASTVDDSSPPPSDNTER